MIGRSGPILAPDLWGEKGGGSPGPFQSLERERGTGVSQFPVPFLGLDQGKEGELWPTSLALN